LYWALDNSGNERKHRRIKMAGDGGKEIAKKREITNTNKKKHDTKHTHKKRRKKRTQTYKTHTKRERRERE